jgi:putative sigma-54 modulation protein
MPVQVEINARNMELNDRLRDYVTKKVAKLDRYLDTLEEAKVDLTYAKSARSANDRQVAQLTVRGKGVLLRAEERTDDMFASVDAVLGKVYRQIERYKGKRWRNRGDGRSASDVAPEIEAPEAREEAELKERIVRRKRFPLSPMDEREAIEQMSLLGHESFFVFLNADTNQVNVLYRRRDGSLGLIETEID